MSEENKFHEIYAVDFDGTLTMESKWPDIGEPNTPFIEWLIKERERGVKLILWTCRENELLEKAISWCQEQGIEFDAVNDNVLEIKEMFGENTRKVTASKYFDDKNSWWIDEKDGPLSMDDAITHCYDVAEKKKDCEDCCKEHHMLARWLEELRDRRRREEDEFMQAAQRTIRETNFKDGKRMVLNLPKLERDTSIRDAVRRFDTKLTEEWWRGVVRYRMIKSLDYEFLTTALDNGIMRRSDLDTVMFYLQDEGRRQSADPIMVFVHPDTDEKMGVRKNIEDTAKCFRYARTLIIRTWDSLEKGYVYYVSDYEKTVRLHEEIYGERAGW